MTCQKGNLIQQLTDIEVIQHGSFTLRSGETSNLYFDLRRIVSYPNVLKSIVQAYATLYRQNQTNFPAPQHVLGVAYTGIPIATLLSQELNLPLLLLRKERKSYGTKKLLEGTYQPGDRVLIIDDVITTGGAILDTIQHLKEHQLEPSLTLTLIDRRSPSISSSSEQPSSEQPSSKQPFYPILSFLKLQDFNHPPIKKNQVTEKLKQIIQAKQSNLVLSADVTTTAELLSLADRLGDQISILKTHMEMISDFDYQSTITEGLLPIQKKHKFLILEDRKLSDIGNTANQQYHQGKFRISSWADLTTCHFISGPKMIESLQPLPENRSLLIIAQLSNQENQITPEYTKAVINFSLEHPELITGLICQNLEQHPGNNQLLRLTPGVNLETSYDQKDQRYRTPKIALQEQKNDLIIVGRGIYQQPTPEKQSEICRTYRREAWKFYQS